MDLFAENLVLQCLAKVKVVVDSPAIIRVSVGDRELASGTHTLAILDAFSRPTLVSKALESFRSRATGALDWVDLMSTVVSLYEAGVLVDERQAAVTPKHQSPASFHIAMLNDRARTTAFIKGLEATIRSEDVVLDIGTGTGVLAIAAAMAGARHVYAVEAGSISELARQIIQVNGLQDRITVIDGWSTRLELPERADVLVSETFGHEPLAEQALTVFSDARKRLLQPDARLIPGVVRVYGLPVAIPANKLLEFSVCDQTLHRWESWYGIDFGPMKSWGGASAMRFFIQPQKAREWQTIGKPVLLCEINLGRDSNTTIHNRVQSTATRKGTVSGILTYFEIEISQAVRISTSPAVVSDDNHWKSAVSIIPRSFDVEANTQFCIEYFYNMNGIPDHAVAYPMLREA